MVTSLAHRAVTPKPGGNCQVECQSAEMIGELDRKIIAIESKAAVALAIIAGIIAVSLGVIGWSMLQLVAHGERSAVLESKRVKDDQDTDKLERQWDRQLEEQKQELRMIKDKLDALLARKGQP